MTGLSLYSRLLRYVRPYRWAFGLAVLGMMVVAAGDLMLAWLVIPIVRNFESPDPLATKWLPLTIVAVFLLRGVGAYISEFGMGWTGYRVVFDLRRDLIDKLLRLPTPYYDTHAAGLIQSKISFDAHQLASAASARTSRSSAWDGRAIASSSTCGAISSTSCSSCRRRTTTRTRRA